MGSQEKEDTVITREENTAGLNRRVGREGHLPKDLGD
jgi:hypothetical protein